MGSSGGLLLVLTYLGVTAGQYFYDAPERRAPLCNETYTGREVSIRNPANQILDDDIIECDYYVQSFSTEVCHLTVNFRNFATLSTPGCQDEYLIINGDKLCGGYLGNRQYPFTGKTAVLRYRGRARNAFQLDLTQILCPPKQQEGLCNVVSGQHQVILTSPSYPNLYPSPSTCRYLLLPSHRDVCQVVVTFNDFALEQSFDCQNDKLIIGDRAYCGDLTGRSFIQNITDSLLLEFEADSFQSDRGFRVTLDQIHCNSSTIPQKQTEFSGQCCGRPYNTPYAVLRSPGFLESNPGLGWNCRYTILPATSRSCRVTLHFKHFWVGEEDVFYGCVNGFLEIDGRRYCGCRDGLTFTTYFNGAPKEIYYQAQSSGIRGFVIEAYQEDCTAPVGPAVAAKPPVDPNTEIEVFSTNITSQKAVSRFFVPTDASRCSRWGTRDWVEQVQVFLINVANAFQCPVTSPNNPPSIGIYPPVTPPIFPPVYPNYPPVYPPVRPPISPPVYPPVTPPISPPTYPNYPPVYPPVRPPISPPVYPPVTPPIAPPTYPNYPPVYPPVRPPISPPVYPPVTPPIAPPTYPNPPIYPPVFPPIAPPVYPPVIPPIAPPVYPPVIPPISPPVYPRCQIFSSFQGYFSSPGYPSNYAPNLRCCYRFLQMPGICSVRLSIFDFDVEWSHKCFKDYLLYDRRQRFCGQRLQSTGSILYFQPDGQAYLDFVTDKFVSGRGFRAQYQMIPCTYSGRNAALTEVEEVSDPDAAPYPPATPPTIQTTTKFDLDVPTE